MNRWENYISQFISIELYFSRFFFIKSTLLRKSINNNTFIFQVQNICHKICHELTRRTYVWIERKDRREMSFREIAYRHIARGINLSNFIIIIFFTNACETVVYDSRWRFLAVSTVFACEIRGRAQLANRRRELKRIVIKLHNTGSLAKPRDND